MIANFKNDNRIIVTGADRAEALLISNMISSYKDKDIELKEFYDIDGDVNGFTIDLKDKEPEPPVNDEVEETVEGE